MRRRAFITLLGGAAAAVCPLAVHSQQSSRMRHIGVLMSLEENDPEGKVQLSGFTQGLSDLGWTNGSNLRMEVRWGGGDVNQIRAFAKELVAAQPDLILSQGTPVTAALQRETRTIPIVFPWERGSLRDCPVRAGISPASSHQKRRSAARCWTCFWKSPPTSLVQPCCSIPTLLPAAETIISEISRLLPDHPKWSRSPQVLKAMPKSKPS